MSNSPKTKENDSFKQTIAKRIFDLLEIVAFGLIIVASLYMVKEMVGYLAGRETSASFFADLKINEHLSKLFCLLFGGGGLFYGFKQNRKRKKEIHRLTEHSRKLELIIDPKRTSSGLSIEGHHHQGD